MQVKKTFIQFIISTLFLCLIPVAGYAASSKGMGSVTYSSWKIKAADKSLALEKAQMNAVERYISKDSVSKMKNFDLVRGQVEKNIGDYILDTSIVSEDLDKSSKRYQVVVRAEINVNRLEYELQKVSAVSNASDDEKSYITFIFVSRQQMSVKSYDDKVVKRVDTESSVDGSDLEQGTAGGVEYASEEYSSKKVTSGGSVTTKADVIEYDVSTTEGINSVMSNVFSTNGFEVVEAEYLEEETGGLISLDAYIEDYRYGNDISGATKRNTAKGAKMAEIPYVALGTLDIGSKGKDPVSGLTKVFVSVSGKVINVERKRPKTVASVGPVQFSGVGPTQTVAINNALSLAAESAAKELAEQLNVRGVK
jgi:hypothetical protein